MQHTNPSPYPHYGQPRAEGFAQQHAAEPSSWHATTPYHRSNAPSHTIPNEHSYPSLSHLSNRPQPHVLPSTLQSSAYNAPAPPLSLQSRQPDSRRPLPEPGVASFSRAPPPRSNSMHEFRTHVSTNNHMPQGMTAQRINEDRHSASTHQQGAHAVGKRPLPVVPEGFVTTPLVQQPISFVGSQERVMTSDNRTGTNSTTRPTSWAGTQSKRALPLSPSAPPDLSLLAHQSALRQGIKSPHSAHNVNGPNVRDPSRWSQIAHSTAENAASKPVNSSLVLGGSDIRTPSTTTESDAGSGCANIAVVESAPSPPHSSIDPLPLSDEMKTMVKHPNVITNSQEAESKHQPKRDTISSRSGKTTAQTFRPHKPLPTPEPEQPTPLVSAPFRTQPPSRHDHAAPNPDSRVSLTFRMASMSLGHDAPSQASPGKLPSAKAPFDHVKNNPAIPHHMRHTESLEDSPPRPFRDLSNSASSGRSTTNNRDKAISTDRPPIPKLSFSEPEQEVNEEPSSSSFRPSIPKIVFGDDSDESPDDGSAREDGPSITITPAVPTISVSSSEADNDSKQRESLSNVSETRRSLDKQRPIIRKGGLICGGCGESIVGRIVSAIGVRWHPGCFQCSICDELLEHVSAYEHEGKPYCHLDYYEQFGHRCYHCNTPIIDEQFITLDDPALGKRTYHEQHFFCAECGDPFLGPSGIDEDDVGFTVYRGYAYCEACHVRLRMPKCSKCKRSIREGMSAVEALGGKWCSDCFLCAGCEKPFESPSFFQRGNKPFCESCFSIIIKSEMD